MGGSESCMRDSVIRQIWGLDTGMRLYGAQCGRTRRTKTRKTRRMMHIQGAVKIIFVGHSVLQRQHWRSFYLQSEILHIFRTGPVLKTVQDFETVVETINQVHQNLFIGIIS